MAAITRRGPTVTVKQFVPATQKTRHEQTAENQQNSEISQRRVGEISRLQSGGNREADQADGGNVEGEKNFQAAEHSLQDPPKQEEKHVQGRCDPLLAKEADAETQQGDDGQRRGVKRDQSVQIHQAQVETACQVDAHPDSDNRYSEEMQDGTAENDGHEKHAEAPKPKAHRVIGRQVKHLADLPDADAVHDSGKEKRGLGPVSPTGRPEPDAAKMSRRQHAADDGQFGRPGQVLPIETDEQERRQPDQQDAKGENHSDVKREFLCRRCFMHDIRRQYGWQ